MKLMTDFEEIFRTYHTILFLYAQKFVQRNIALDLVQDIFVAMWEKKKFDMDELSVKAYLFKSVRNSCLNYLKHEKIVSKHMENKLASLSEQEICYYESGEKSFIEKEDLDKIYGIINSLPDIYREIIELSRFDGLRNKEIAEKLDIPLRTVETRLFRALSMLKEKLSNHLFLLFCMPDFYRLS